MQASPALGLPCSWAPLQSMTAAASRRIPCSRRACGEIAGQSHHAARSECCASGPDSRTRRRAYRAFVAVPDKPGRQRSRILEGFCPRCGVCRPKPALVTPRCHKWRRGREHCRDELRSLPGRSSGAGASSVSRSRPKPLSRHRSYPFGGHRPKPRAPSGVPTGTGCLPTHRSELAGTVLPKDASRLRATEVGRWRKTRSGNSTTSPMGFGSFRRINPGDRCAGLPLRHRPLSGFLTLSAV
jgi:hypothetical protein